MGWGGVEELVAMEGEGREERMEEEGRGREGEGRRGEWMRRRGEAPLFADPSHPPTTPSLVGGRV